MHDRDRLLRRIYKLKLLAVGLSLAFLGLAASLGADWLDSAGGASHFLVALLRAASDVLLVAGAIGIAVDFFTGRAKDEADTERTRTVLKELTPEFVDAVVKGFSVNKDDLKRVASPEALDDIATNVLSLRLGDDQFAREIYEDVRDQAIRAPERWYDVNVSIRLSAIAERNTFGVPLFDVSVQWEYTTVPSHNVRRFACVSDRDEYRELASELPVTSAWFMSPRPGLDASRRESFELLYFGINGDEQAIRRQQRKGGQTYTVRLDEEVVREGRSVRIRHIYRTRTTQAGHFLFLEMPQPARGLSLTVDYVSTPIVQLRVTDLLTSTRRTLIVRKPDITGEKSVSVDHAGWILPSAGIAIAWTLLSEESPGAAEAARPAA